MISPLNREQLSLYLRANDLFEKSAGLACNNRIVVPAVQDMVTKFTIPQMVHATADNYLFYTFWMVVEKSSRLIVAELGFKGIPTGNGEIEIGYGTMPAHQGKGFMTEAVGGMLGWGKCRPDISCILAETDETNTASIKVLRKNNFHQFARKGSMLWWKYLV